MGDWLQDDKHDVCCGAFGPFTAVGGITGNLFSAAAQQSRCPECGHTLGSMSITENHEPGCSRIQGEIGMMRPATITDSMLAMQNAYRPSIATCKENLDAQREFNAQQADARFDLLHGSPLRPEYACRITDQPSLFARLWAKVRKLFKFAGAA